MPYGGAGTNADRCTKVYSGENTGLRAAHGEAPVDMAGIVRRLGGWLACGVYRLAANHRAEPVTPRAEGL